MPDTVTVGTWNVWKKSGQPAHWPSRRPAVIRTIQRLDTDILMLQEAHPLITEAILEAKPTYCTVQDEFPGWGHEGMILWDNTKWEEVEHGAVDVGLSPPDRRLFWVRLRLRSAQRTVLVATAHLTWPGHAQEVASAVNVRKAQARAMARALSQGLVRAQEPAFVAGDFNEGFWPRKLLNVAGFVDCFWELGARVPVTHPAYPCGDEDEDCLDAATLDWLTSNANAQASEAGVMEDMPRHGPGGLQASDHCPVWAQYTLIDEPRAFRAFRPTIEVALDDPPPCS